MKKIQLLIISLFSFGAIAQNISKINSDLNISDSLNHEIEIRIYQIGGITNYNSLFRMFKDNSEKWTAKFYEHYSKVDKQSKIRILEKSVKSEHDMDFVYQNLLRSHILELSNLDDIKWKLESRGPVIPFENKVNGELVKEYGFIINKSAILDGKTYTIQVKALGKTNSFSYSNPESYFKKYPEVDELIYVCEILDIIKSEFNIWKK
tara:strand:+ start:55 stop:675 length:621 start_codon:yes stop_codon:yes gene_type:complete